MRIRIITEQALQKNDFKYYLQGHQYQIQDNLIRIYCWKDTDLKQHWVQELYAQLNRCPLLKHNKKYPSKEFIYEHIYNEFQDSFTDKKFLIEIESDAYIENKDIPYYVYTDMPGFSHLKGYLSEYCLWISEQLSVDGIVSPQDIEQEVNNLLDKYID